MSAAPSPLFEALERQGVRERCKRQPLRKHARSVQVLGGQLVDIPAIVIRTGIGIWSICKYGKRMFLAECLANQASCEKTRAP